MEDSFRLWIHEICGKYRGIVCIDGKEVRSAREERKDGSFEPLRMVSAWAAANGMCLGQEKVAEVTAGSRETGATGEKKRSMAHKS